METQSVPVTSILTKTGFKPAKTRLHDFMRIFLLLGVVVLIYYSIKLEHPKVIYLKDMSDTIPPGSLMYRMVSEMDDATQCRYLRSLQSTLEPEQPRTSKYISSLRIALIAGLASEYITNGNSIKPIGTLARTVIYTTIYTIATL